MQFFRGCFKVKNVSITVNYTSHMRPDIINPLRFFSTDKILSTNAIRLFLAVKIF